MVYATELFPPPCRRPSRCEIRQKSINTVTSRACKTCKHIWWRTSVQLLNARDIVAAHPSFVPVSLIKPGNTVFDDCWITCCFCFLGNFLPAITEFLMQICQLRVFFLCEELPIMWDNHRDKWPVYNRFKAASPLAHSGNGILNGRTIGFPCLPNFPHEFMDLDWGRFRRFLGSAFLLWCQI